MIEEIEIIKQWGWVIEIIEENEGERRRKVGIFLLLSILYMPNFFFLVLTRKIKKNNDKVHILSITVHNVDADYRTKKKG